MRWPWVRRKELDAVQLAYEAVAEQADELRDEIQAFKSERDGALTRDVRSSRAHAREYRRLRDAALIVAEHRKRAEADGAAPVVPCGELEPILGRQGDGNGLPTP